MSNKKRNVIAFIILLTAIISTVIIGKLDLRIITVEELNVEIDGVLIHSVANDLIFQYTDSTGNIWVSAGYSIYFIPFESSEYNRIARLSIPLGEELFGHFRYFRNLLDHNELLELMITKEGTLKVFTAGYIFRSIDSGENFAIV